MDKTICYVTIKDSEVESIAREILGGSLNSENSVKQFYGILLDNANILEALTKMAIGVLTDYNTLNLRIADRCLVEMSNYTLTKTDIDESLNRGYLVKTNIHYYHVGKILEINPTSAHKTYAVETKRVDTTGEIEKNHDFYGYQRVKPFELYEEPTEDSNL
jgi:hypothetical protein